MSNPRFGARLDAEPVGNSDTLVSYRIQNIASGSAGVDSEATLYIDGEAVETVNLREDADDALDAEDLEPGDLSVEYTHTVGKRNFEARVFVGSRSSEVSPLHNPTTVASVRNGVVSDSYSGTIQRRPQPSSEPSVSGAQARLTELRERVADIKQEIQERRSRVNQLERENEGLRSENERIRDQLRDVRSQRDQAETSLESEQLTVFLPILRRLSKLVLGR